MNILDKGVSIIICCHNSALKLPDTLKYISLQEVTKDINWEVIIVDNNSNDGTSEIAKVEWKKDGEPTILKIVNELTPGLSFARKKGISEAQFDYIIFCDDDNLLFSDYVHQTKRLLDTYPEYGIIGGNNYFHSYFRNYVSENHISNYAIGEQTIEEIEDLTSTRGAVWGAGMILRKTVFESLRRVNFSSLLSDRKGKELSSGGDVEICYAARLLNWKIGASRLLNLNHNVSENRFHIKYLLNLKASFGKDNPFLNIYEKAWLYKYDRYSRYNYKLELINNLKIIFNHKKAFLVYFLGQSKYREDVIELPYFIAKIKTILRVRSKLNEEFERVISNYL